MEDTNERKDRVLLRPWLENMLENGHIPGLEWYDKEQMMFKVPWKHRSKKDWSLRHSSVFLEWARNTGRWSEGDPAPYFAQLKTRLRCAFNKAPDIEEMKQYHARNCEEPYKVYRFTPRRDMKAGGRRSAGNSLTRTTVPMTARRYQDVAVRAVADENIECDDVDDDDNVAAAANYEYGHVMPYQVNVSVPYLISSQPFYKSESCHFPDVTENMGEADVDIKPRVIPLTVELLSDSDDSEDHGVSLPSGEAPAVSCSSSSQQTGPPSKLLLLQMATMFVEAHASRQQSEAGDSDTDDAAKADFGGGSDIQINGNEPHQQSSDMGSGSNVVSSGSCGATGCDMSVAGSNGTGSGGTDGAKDASTCVASDGGNSAATDSTPTQSTHRASASVSWHAETPSPSSASGLLFCQKAIDLTRHDAVTSSKDDMANSTGVSEIIDLADGGSPDADTAVDLTHRLTPTTLNRVLPVARGTPVASPKPVVSVSSTSLRQNLMAQTAIQWATGPRSVSTPMIRKVLQGGGGPQLVVSACPPEVRSVADAIKLKMQSAACKVEDDVTIIEDVKHQKIMDVDVIPPSLLSPPPQFANVDDLRQYYMHKEHQLMAKTKELLEKELQLRSWEQQLATKQEMLYWRERCLRSEFSNSKLANGELSTVHIAGDGAKSLTFRTEGHKHAKKLIIPVTANGTTFAPTTVDFEKVKKCTAENLQQNVVSVKLDVPPVRLQQQKLCAVPKVSTVVHPAVTQTPALLPTLLPMSSGIQTPRKIFPSLVTGTQKLILPSRHSPVSAAVVMPPVCTISPRPSNTRMTLPARSQAVTPVRVLPVTSNRRAVTAEHKESAADVKDVKVVPCPPDSNIQSISLNDVETVRETRVLPPVHTIVQSMGLSIVGDDPQDVLASVNFQVQHQTAVSNSHVQTDTAANKLPLVSDKCADSLNDEQNLSLEIEKQSSLMSVKETEQHEALSADMSGGQQTEHVYVQIQRPLADVTGRSTVSNATDKTSECDNGKAVPSISLPFSEEFKAGSQAVVNVNVILTGACTATDASAGAFTTNTDKHRDAGMKLPDENNSKQHMTQNVLENTLNIDNVVAGCGVEIATCGNVAVAQGDCGNVGFVVCDNGDIDGGTGGTKRKATSEEDIAVKHAKII